MLNRQGREPERTICPEPHGNGDVQRVCGVSGDRSDRAIPDREPLLLLSSSRPRRQGPYSDEATEVREQQRQLILDDRLSHAHEQGGCSVLQGKTAQCTPSTMRRWLNREILDTVLEARMLAERYRWEYATIRPRRSREYRPPAPEAIGRLPTASACSKRAAPALA